MVQLELSFVPLYGGEILFDAAHARMRSLGFGIAGMSPAFSDPDSGRLLQVDVLFART